MKDVVAQSKKNRVNAEAQGHVHVRDAGVCSLDFECHVNTYNKCMSDARQERDSRSLPLLYGRDEAAWRA
ncbi:MAG: hypothetical protein NVS2B16_10300 [Chloroflexota bacterium]